MSCICVSLPRLFGKKILGACPAGRVVGGDFFGFFIGVSSTCGRFVRGLVPAGWVAGGGFFGVTCCDQGRAIVLGDQQS